MVAQKCPLCDRVSELKHKIECVLVMVVLATLRGVTNRTNNCHKTIDWHNQVGFAKITSEPLSESLSTFQSYNSTLVLATYLRRHLVKVLLSGVNKASATLKFTVKE